MFKKILKIVGIVLGCTVIGVGILAGVLALQGKFKEPYQEPNSIYFDLDDGVLDVTYYCDNFIASQKDENYELVKNDPSLKNKLNIYSFVLKATPDDVTELDCTMAVETGSDLIEFCNSKGEVYSGGKRSKIKIGERVYFKIKNSFDNAIAQNTNDNYNATGGEVKLYFNTSNNLHNAYLTIKIDRQTSQVSLKDWNNSANNTHTNGVFDFEQNNLVYTKVEGASEDAVETYYVKEGADYRPFGKGLDGSDVDDKFDDFNEFFVRSIDPTLYLTVEANSEFKLEPIFAPDNSNKPFKSGAKMCDVFYLDIADGYYYNITDTTHIAEFIVEKDGEYYFNASQAGKYELYVVAYPTYKVQQAFLADFESDNTSDKIFNNLYAVSRKVEFTVENSGIKSVYFNDGNVLNLNLDLFKENQLYVQNSSKANNLNLSMENNVGVKIYSRFNQLEFLDLSKHYLSGGVEFVYVDKKISIAEGSETASVTGYSDNKNGQFKYEVIYDNAKNELSLSLDNGQTLKFSNIKISGDGIFRIESEVASDGSNLWTITNGVLLVKRTTVSVSGGGTTVNYELGSIDVGAYLVMLSNTTICNDKFSIVAGGYGVNKMWNIVPLEEMTELSLYCFVVNQDKSVEYTNQAVSVAVDQEETTIAPNLKTDTSQPIKIVSSSEVQSYDVSELLTIQSGDYKFPLMFVEDDGDIKVKVIPQIYFEQGKTRYVLVGDIDAYGGFVNKVIPLYGKIGQQKIYSLIVKYNYEKVKNYGDLFDGLMSKQSGVMVTVSLAEKPADWGDYYTLVYSSDAYSFEKVDIDADFNPKNLYFKPVQASTDFAFSKLQDNYQTFVSSPIVTFDLVYTSNLENGDLGFKLTTYTHNGSEMIECDDKAEVAERTHNDGGDRFYINIGLISTNNTLLKLIAGATNAGEVATGLNKYFDLGMKTYDSKGELSATASISCDTDGKYTINNAELSQWFSIKDIQYVEDSGGIGYIKVRIDVGHDNFDNFEGLSFKLWFGYNKAIKESVAITITSTAVTGYQFKVDGQGYAFDEYKVVYTVDYEKGKGYKWTAQLVKKSDNTVVTLSERSADSLEDTSLLACSGEDGTYITTLNGPNSEFGFSILSSDEKVLSFDGNTILINGIGVASIKLTNTTKTSVTSSFSVEVKSALSVTKSKDNRTIKVKTQSLNDKSDNIFSYMSSNKPAEELFNESGLITFAISDIQPTEFGIAVDNAGAVYTIVDKTNNNAVVLTLEYDGSNWQLTRSDDYVLAVFGFNLTAYTPFAEGQTVAIDYTSPVKIEKNANNSMSVLDEVPYYDGTTLTLATAVDNTDDSLFKLTNTSGSGDFELQIYWYEQLQEAPSDTTGKIYYVHDGTKYVETTDFDAIKAEPTSYFVKKWIKLAGGTPLQLKPVYDDKTGITDNLTAYYRIDYNQIINARIYFNDNKFYQFKIKVLENVFIETINSDGSQNAQNTPQEMSLGGAGMSLSDILPVRQYNTTDALLDYSSDKIGNLNADGYSVNSADTNTDMFDISGDDLSLTWVNTVGERVYELKLDVKVGVKTYIASYFVKATSSYTIDQKKNLPELTPFKETTFDVTEYFAITNGPDEVTGFTATVVGFKDSDCSISDSYLTYSSDKLNYVYPYVSNSVRYLVFSFVIDGKTLTDNIAYPIYIANLELTIDELVAGSETDLKTLFDLENAGIFEKGIKKIVVTSTDSRITLINNEDIIDITSTAKIKAEIKGENYSSKLNIQLYYSDSEYYEYEATLSVVNPNYAQIVGVDFDDLKVNINNDLIDTNGNEMNFVKTLNYQPVLAGEVVTNLKNLFKIYDKDGLELTDNKYKLANIELLGTINLNGDLNYVSKILINNDNLTVTIGGFTRVGYAVFKLSDSEGTSCYYAMRITPTYMGATETYHSVLTDNNHSRKTVSDQKTYDSGKTSISDYVELLMIAQTTGVIESTLTTNNVYYYLKVDETKYLIDKNDNAIGKRVTGELTEVKNPTTISLAVLLQTTNAVVYLCDYTLTIMPNVTVTPKDATTLAGYYTYGKEITYSYPLVAGGVANNSFNFGDILEVGGGASLDNVEVIDVTDNKIGIKYNSTSIIDNDGNAVATFSKDSGIILTSNISEEITITLKLTYSNELIVTLKLTYKPFKNENSTRVYKLGWNGSSFNNTLSQSDLVKNYKGNISASLDGIDITANSGAYEFSLGSEETTQTLVLTLDDIVGTPSYTYTIILGVNIHKATYKGETESDSVKTIQSSSGSTLKLVGNNSYQIKLSTTGLQTNDEVIFVLDCGDIITLDADNPVTFYDINGNETGFVSLDGDTLTFVDSATDISGKLKIKTNKGEYFIFVTMTKTYSVTPIYRTGIVGDSETTYADFETVKVGDTLSFTDFMSTSLPSATLDKMVVNSSRFKFDGASMSLITDPANTYNKASWQLMYSTTSGMVADSNHIYADESGTTFTFKTAGTVYIRLTNATGLELDYKLIIQESNYFVDNVTWNAENENTGVESSGDMYYSTDISTLNGEAGDGYKLASLTFNPSNNNDLTLFRLYVDAYYKNGTKVGGTNSYDQSDETRGKFEVSGGITLEYKIENFNVYMTASKKTDDITVAYFDLLFVTVNGVNNKVRLYVTNITIETGMQTGIEYIYANQEGLTLSTKLDNGNKRVTIKNVDNNNLTEITYNSGNYKLYYNGAKNVTTGKAYAKSDNSLVEVKEGGNNYMTDVFSLKSIAQDNNISLYYYLTYNDIRIANFDYRFIMRNDIKITVNNFDNGSEKIVGDIYLNSYPYSLADKEFTVDLINKTDNTYYRNEYIVYENLRSKTKLFNGSADRTIASYMKFELVNSYLGTSSRDVFSEDEILIDENGSLTVRADKSGTIGVKITAQNCPGYSVIVEINIVATIEVTQAYADNETDKSQISAYAPLTDVHLISYGSDFAMLKLSKTSTGSDYVTKNENLASAPSIKVEYAILESLNDINNARYNIVTPSWSDSVCDVKLPVVPFSTTQSYIVSYKVTITQNDTGRTYYCNYKVMNNADVQITGYYTNKEIEVGAGAQSDGNNLTIFKSGIIATTDSSALFTAGDVPALLNSTNGAKYIRFENIVDATGNRVDTPGFMPIASDYKIDLTGIGLKFNNFMTFDIVCYNSNTNSATELYRSTGWTMRASGMINPKHSKRLNYIFTEAELGSALLDKEFVAVTADGTTALKTWFESVDEVGSEDDVKEITREAGTYKIYSFTATKTGGGDFYNLQGTFYFIYACSGAPTDFIVTDNWYISYIVKDISNSGLEIDVTNNAQMFNGSAFTNDSITSISSSDKPNYVSISGTKIEISSTDLQTLKGDNVTSCEFYIKIDGGGTSRTVKVVITFDFKVATAS